MFACDGRIEQDIVSKNRFQAADLTIYCDLFKFNLLIQLLELQTMFIIAIYAVIEINVAPMNSVMNIANQKNTVHSINFHY